MAALYFRIQFKPTAGLSWECGMVTTELCHFSIINRYLVVFYLHSRGHSFKTAGKSEQVVICFQNKNFVMDKSAYERIQGAHLLPRMCQDSSPRGRRSYCKKLLLLPSTSYNIFYNSTITFFISLFIQFWLSPNQLFQLWLIFQLLKSFTLFWTLNFGTNTELLWTLNMCVMWRIHSYNLTCLLLETSFA